MKLEQFAMERMQSTYENLVEFNLSESGVHPLTAAGADRRPGGLEVLDQPSSSTHSRTAPMTCARRSRRSTRRAASITSKVTNGGSEANFITTLQLVEPGDEVVMLVPNYMQTWGLARAFGGASASGTGRGSRRPDDGASIWPALERLVIAATRLDRHLQSQ